MGETQEVLVEVPWSARSPQKWFFSALAVVLTVAIMGAALTAIGKGEGTVVPYLMLVVGPVLGVFYFWYFAIKRW
ncbi:MAG: hypothetical protein EXQ60_02035 [Candidatus Nanopelagicales bacterium]|nr:hypothetical protein [Candidatus Nanopelagicales bacterium]